MSFESFEPQERINDSVSEELKAEREQITNEAALEQEKGVFRKLSGRAKELAGLFLLTSVVACAEKPQEKSSGMQTQTSIEQVYGYSEKSAVSTPLPVTREQKPSEVQQPQVNKKQTVSHQEVVSSVTEKQDSSWSGSIIKEARVDWQRIGSGYDKSENESEKEKYKTEAQWLVRSHFGSMVNEFYFPTQGKIEKGAYDLNIRIYTEEEASQLLQNLYNMRDLLQEMNHKVGLEAYDKRIDQLNDMIMKMKNYSPYTMQKSLDALKKAEELLNK